MKPIIKKKIKNLAISLTCTDLIASTLTVGAHHALSEIVHKDNSSNEQINQYQEEFNVVSGYRHTNGERLKHNDGEPIYIQIDNEYTPDQREIIKQALDFIFGLVGDINDNYKYAVVDDINQLKYWNKTKIKFDVKETVLYYGQEVYGLYTSYNNWLKSQTKGTFIQRANIDMDNDHAKDLDELYYTTLHETFHLFGVKDVYPGWQSEIYHNTYINVGTNHKLKMITPNDYKLLISLYAKDMSKSTKSEKQNYIQQLEQKIHDYSCKYYAHYHQVSKQSLIDSGITEAVNEISPYAELDNDIDVTFTAKGLTKGISKIRIKVKGEKYKLATYDENDNLLETCSGKAYNVGGQIFLQNVELKNLYNGQPTYTDLCIEMLANETKYYRLRDAIIIYSVTGINTEYYNQQNQGLSQ